MKNCKVIAIALSMTAISAFTHSAAADSSAATCEFYSHGDKEKDRSGPCTFSQRQGYVDITLKNGKTFSLSPGNKPDHYKDQEDHKVVRESAGGGKDVYKWDQKKIVVSFNQQSAAPSQPSAGDYMGKTPDNLRDLVGAKAGQAEGALGQRGYTFMKSSDGGGAKYSSWEDNKTGRCVMIHTADGRYQSIVYAPDADCQL